MKADFFQAIEIAANELHADIISLAVQDEREITTAHSTLLRRPSAQMRFLVAASKHTPSNPKKVFAVRPASGESDFFRSRDTSRKSSILSTRQLFKSNTESSEFALSTGLEKAKVTGVWMHRVGLT